MSECRERECFSYIILVMIIPPMCNGGPYSLKVCILTIINKPKYQRFVFPRLCHFPDFDIYHNYDMPICDTEHTEGATGQQRMFTPPRHLILPFFLEVRVALL